MQRAEQCDNKGSVDARGLLTAVCDSQFIIGLQVLKVIFCNTNALSTLTGAGHGCYVSESHG